MKHVNSARVEVVAVAIYLVAIGFPASTEAVEETITFNNPTSLAALSYTSRGQKVTAGRYTFVASGPPPAAYKEAGMVFSEGITPPDPALGPIPQGHYHLMYEDPALNDPANQSPAKLPDPENKGRYLAPMCPGAVIQMTYHPDNVRVPAPFSLRRIQVLTGSLNVGIKSNKFGIGVFNNLTGGTTWNLGEDGENITRATFELPRGAKECGGFVIDNIVFEPFPATQAAPLSASPTTGISELSTRSPELSSSFSLSSPSSVTASPPFADAATLTFLNGDFAPLPKIDIRPFTTTNDINPLDTGVIRVAIITTEGFDATSVDPRSIEFGPNGAKEGGQGFDATSVDPLSVEFGPDGAEEADQGGRITDVDGDGDADLLLHFSIPEVGVQCSDIALSLTGRTFDGQTIIGSDFIRTRCEDKAEVDLD